MKESHSARTAQPFSEDPGLPKRLQTYVLVALISFGVYLCYAMAAPFLPAIALALALAVLFAPFQRWLEAKLKYPGLATLTSVLVIGLMVVAPITFVAHRLATEAIKSTELIGAKIESGEWRRAIEAQPRLASLVDRVERQLDLPGTAKTIASSLNTTVGAIVKGSIVQAIGFALTFYLLFFFLRDREIVLRTIRSLTPLTNEELKGVFCRTRDTIYATVYGTLAVSSVQGLLGGLMFWWLGLPAPLLWGIAMALLAIVPVLGAFVVWLPAAVFLALDGHWGKALILTAWGVVVVGTVDNLLRPILVGNRLQLHTILVFLSLVGGVFLLGATGLIIGPITLAITTELLEIWHRRTAGITALPD